MKSLKSVVALVSLAALLSYMAPLAPVAYSRAPVPQSDNGAEHRADPCLQSTAVAVLDNDNPSREQTGSDRGVPSRCPVRSSSAGIAKGDFNGDGIGDLAIGVPDEDLFVLTTRSTIVDAGAVHIIYGTAASGLATSGTGIPTTQMITQVTGFRLVSPTFLAGNHHRFGAALASGDFNGDTFSDLAVAIPGELVSGEPGVGAVEIFFGSADGLHTAASEFFGPSTFTRFPDTTSNSLQAATALSWGDFDGDGKGDLAVASNYLNDDNIFFSIGAATILYGSSNGLTTTRQQLFETEQELADSFPHVLLTLSGGDFNKDGCSDLVAGSTIANSITGAVFTLYGVCGTGLSDANGQQWKESDFGNAPSAGDEFGGALAVGDFNRDGAADLAIGAPSDLVGTVRAGAIYILYGAPGVGLQVGTGSLAPKRFTQTDFSATSSEAGDRFGAALAAGDFDGDGAKDLAIGIPGESVSVITHTGRVEILYSAGNAGLSLTGGHAPQTFSESGLFRAWGSGDQFGASLTAWNFGLSTQADLAVAAPFRDVGGVNESGAVYVIYSNGTGLSGTGNQIWTQGSGGLPDTPEAGDHFGLAIY